MPSLCPCCGADLAYQPHDTYCVHNPNRQTCPKEDEQVTYVVTPKGLAIIQEALIQLQITGLSFNTTYNAVLGNITDEMVALWRVCCGREGIDDLRSSRAQQIFHELYGEMTE